MGKDTLATRISSLEMRMNAIMGILVAIVGKDYVNSPPEVILSYLVLLFASGFAVAAGLSRWKYMNVELKALFWAILLVVGVNLLAGEFLAILIPYLWIPRTLIGLVIVWFVLRLPTMIPREEEAG